MEPVPIPAWLIHDGHALPEPADLGGVSQLVRWATRAPADPDAVPGESVHRDVLAAALGLRRDQLGHLDLASAERALGRLRGVVHKCQRLAAAVAVDELTGVLRRGIGLKGLEREMARHQRRPGKGLVVAFVDVDGLKRVNDSAGHSAGDDLLRVVVAAMRERLRSYDLIVRYGGDEFLCVLSDTDLGEAQGWADDISNRVAEITDGNSVSVGLAAWHPDDLDAQTLVRRADQQLYATRRARGHGAVAREATA